MLAILPLIIVGILIYFTAIRPFRYWKNKNVKTTKVKPLFGENFYTIFGIESFPEQMLRLYNNFPDDRYFGFYQFTRPILLLRTPELIKQLYVKDSDCFLNRQTFVPDHADDLFSRNLIALKGEEWKHTRSTLSPTFTISKMKAMFTFISNNADQFVKYFLDKKQKVVKVEFTDAMSRFTNDVIAASAYGLQVDSLKDRHNVFYEMGRRATNFIGFKTKFAICMYLMVPRIAAFLGLTIIDKEVQSFFINLVKDTIEMRREKNIKRPDVIGVLMGDQEKDVNDKTREKEKEGFAVVEEHLEGNEIKQDLNYKDIAAHSFLFFVAGFEGISNLLCYIVYELALNPDIQKKLIEEVDEICPLGELPSYGQIMNMEYLDMVVCETLRKWPSALETERVVTKEYTIKSEKPGEESLRLEPETVVMISILGLHRDPKYFENPGKFDPERFSPENRRNINPYAYLPFGVGVRNCVGSRFAVMGVKILIFKILCHFEIVPVERTQIPLKFNKKAFKFKPTDGFHLGLQMRI